MAIIATGGPSGEKYPLVPAGTYSAVCVDVVDEGMKESTFGEKKKLQQKVSIWWQLDEERPDKPGERFTIRKWYTLSLNEKASLYADLVAWRGRPFTEEELKGFDLEKLIGVPALVTVVHEKGKGDGSTTFANVKAVASPPKGMTRLKAENYVRRKDRPQKNEGEKYDRDMADVMAEQAASSMGSEEDDRPVF